MTNLIATFNLCDLIFQLRINFLKDFHALEPSLYASVGASHKRDTRACTWMSMTLQFMRKSGIEGISPTKHKTSSSLGGRKVNYFKNRTRRFINELWGFKLI